MTTYLLALISLISNSAVTFVKNSRVASVIPYYSSCKLLVLLKISAPLQNPQEEASSGTLVSIQCVLYTQYHD